MIDLTTLPAWAKNMLRCVQIARGLTLRRSPKPAFRWRRKPLAWRAASLSGLAAAGPTVVMVVSNLTGLAASANVASVALTRNVMGGAVGSASSAVAAGAAGCGLLADSGASKSLFLGGCRVRNWPGAARPHIERGRWRGWGAATYRRG